VGKNNIREKIDFVEARFCCVCVRHTAGGGGSPLDGEFERAAACFVCVCCAAKKILDAEPLPRTHFMQKR
jgi:hypothetical protein